MQRVADELGRGCRDKGWRSGREGALCLSRGRERLRWYSGCSEVSKPTGRGQARGPRIRLTPPLVPTHMPIVRVEGASTDPHPPHTAHCPYGRR